MPSLRAVFHHVAEMRVEFRRAARDVERADAPERKKIEHHVSNIAGHFLGAVGAGIDVAMEARLVAAVADIDLQCVELAAADCREWNLVEQRQRVAHVFPRSRRQLATSRASCVTPLSAAARQKTVSKM